MLLPVILLANANFYFFWAFDRYDAWENFSESDRPVARENFLVLMSKLNPPFENVYEGYEPVDFFSERDLAHMEDVQNLFRVVWSVVGLAVVILAGVGAGRAFTQASPDLGYIRLIIDARLLRRLHLGYCGLLAVVGLAGLGAWQQVFYIFHLMLFPQNDYWILDSVSSNLIKYFDNLIFLELFIVYTLAQGLIYFYGRVFYKRRLMSLNN